MNPFFSTPEQIAALNREAESWLGTPFAPHASVRGAGADCVGLIAGIYLAVGVIKSFEAGTYTLDEGSHLHASKVQAWFAHRPEFASVPLVPFDPLPGDTLLFNLARVGHHTGLLLTPEFFIHAFPRRAVMLSSLRESFYTARIVAIFRAIIPHSEFRSPQSGQEGK